MDAGEMCSSIDEVLKFVGWIIVLFKVAIPVLLIVFGMFDLGKAVTSQDDKEIKTAQKKLINRAIAAVAIFFIPKIVEFIFGAISGFSDNIKTYYEECAGYIFSPWD